jgi:hypothetical protein
MKTFSVAILLSGVSALGSSVCEPTCGATESCTTKKYYTAADMASTGTGKDVAVCVATSSCYDTTAVPAPAKVAVAEGTEFVFNIDCNTLGQRVGPSNLYSDGTANPSGTGNSFYGCVATTRACTKATDCCGKFKDEVNDSTNGWGSSDYCGDGMGAVDGYGSYYSSKTWWHTCGAAHLVASAGAILAASYLI